MRSPNACGQRVELASSVARVSVMMAKEAPSGLRTAIVRVFRALSAPACGYLTNVMLHVR